MTTPPALHAPSITKRLRRNGVDVYSHLHAPGVIRVWTIENDKDDAVARARAVLLQAGYEVATAHGYEGALLVTLPVEEPEDDEPVIVRAGQAAPLAQHDAPRQDLDGEVRYDEQGNARYWTADEVAAERAEQLLDEVEVRAEQQHADDEADREANTVGPVTADEVADAILDRRPILDLFPGRARETGSLTREQAEAVDAGVTIAMERLAAQYGTTPAEVIRLGREVVEETLTPVK